MAKPTVIDDIRKEESSEFVYPRYGERSLAEVVPTILDVFGIPMARAALPEEFYRYEAEGCNKVVMFFVDGLGYDQVVRYQNLPLFDILHKKARVNPITTVFPSTTASAITTIHTGLTPQEHGLPEWNVYFEEIDMVIQTLPFKAAGQKRADELLDMGLDPKILYSGPTVYEKLKAKGVKSFVFTHRNIAHSAYSGVSQRGSEIIPYTRGSDLMVKLRRKLMETAGPAYFYIYWDAVDHSEHDFGPHSEEHESELSVFSHLVASEFLGKLGEETAKDVLFLLTADHGQMNVREDKLIYLEEHLALEDLLRRRPNTEPIPPTGCPRDVFLFIEPTKLRTALELLKARLEGKAEVILTEDAVKRGLFGTGKPTKKFLKRIGDILLLPYSGYNLWNNGFKKAPSEFPGIHGGLSEEEMVIPFVAARLSDLL